jgi:bacterioferritin-associated ferredoxin
VFVCLCRAVSSKTICSVIEAGAASVEEVGARSGAGTVCGKCQHTIEILLREHGPNAPVASKGAS